jgi:hypothetical protein
MAARIQSWADEKAQISDVTPAESRMHHVSALAIAGIAVASAANTPMTSDLIIATSLRVSDSTSLIIL